MADSQSEKARAAKHERARAEMLEEFERKRLELQKETVRSSRSAQERFQSHKGSLEESLKRETVGLVSADDFRKRREELEEQRRREAASTNELKTEEKRKKKDKKGAKAKLSFALDDEEEGEEEAVAKPTKKRKTDGTNGNGTLAANGNGASSANGSASPAPAEPTANGTNGVAKSGAAPPKKSLKNPAVNTSFLPDREREEEERRLREELRQEWLKKQEVIKNELVEITYSYWDGSGHRKTVKCKKGETIAQFLEKCRQQFPELRGTSVDNLMYIKEDLIIPHHHTFYEFIINKARGKSGPLFNFDVHDDVRMVADASVEKDESHAGKVCTREWYSRNKAHFPASRWELYEPGKQYGAYTIK